MELTDALKLFEERKDLSNWFGTLQHLYPTEPKFYRVSLIEYRKEVQRQLADGVDVKENYERLKQSYLLSARDSLDDYMIYIEWDRDSDKKFWLPRRDILLDVCNDVQRLIEGELDLVTTSLPPGTGKSTLKIYVLSWLMGKYPDKHNLDSGYSDKMTRSTYEGVLSILTDKVEYLWGDVFPEAGAVITNAKELTIDIGKKHRFSTLTCRAIEGSLTGTTRCDGLLTADDLISGIEEAFSKERLQKKWDEYTNNLKSRKKIQAKEWHIATRWSVYDVIGRLQSQYRDNPDRAVFRVIPALNNEGHSNFNYKYNVGFDDKYFYDMKDSMDDASFRALFMNEPIEREGLLYFPDELERFYEIPKDLEPDIIDGVCDPTNGGGDDTVLPVFYVYGDKHYLVDVVCSNALPGVTNSLCANILIQHKVERCQFESNAMGLRAADEVQALIEGKCKCHITKKQSRSNKEAKIIAYSDWVKKHVVFKDERVIEKGSPYYWFMQKLCGYTQTGKNKHDDVPDAMAMYAMFSTTNNVCKATLVKRFF